MSVKLSFGYQGHPPHPGAGGLAFLAVLMCACAVASCSRGEDSRPVAVPSATLTPKVVATNHQPSGGPAPVASASGSPTDVSAADDDFEWNLVDEAQGPDFEIDADATSYYMPLANTVTFKAKALNGTPPFTFTWNFGDGAPEVTGELVKHTYTALGNFSAVVTGKDASGATHVVELRLLVTTPEDFVSRMHLDPKLLENLPSPAVTP